MKCNTASGREGTKNPKWPTLTSRHAMRSMHTSHAATCTVSSQLSKYQLTPFYESQRPVGVNPTMTLVANSSGGLKLQGGKMGTSGLSQGCSARPGCDSQEVDCDGSDDMLQVGFGKTSVAGAAYSAASDRLGMSAFYTCPIGIGLPELLRCLSRSHLLESFMIFPGLESNDAGFLL